MPVVRRQSGVRRTGKSLSPDDTGREEITRPDNERPEPIDVGAVVVASAIREQLAPFLERQEARDERMMQMLERMIDATNDHATRLGRLEERMVRLEAGCLVQHGGSRGTGPTT